MISKTELFSRLDAQVSVVTPNRRLAQALMREFDAFQIEKGLPSWEAPDILPLDAFVARLYEDALYAGARVPLLLAPAQEQQLWRQIVGRAGLLSVEEAAASCRKAWELMHAWRVRPAGGGEDAAVFATWAGEYQRGTEGQVDAARLPDAMAEYLQHARLPKLVVAYAFDIVTPQAKEFLARFALEHCQPEARPGKIARGSFASAKEEIEAAARWARARLEQGRQRIGVVIPELRKRRREVARIFAGVMQPGYNFPGCAKPPMPFNLSLGLPLGDYPLVGAALDLLELSLGEIAFERASRLVRSPFLGGAESESARRAALDVFLRKDLDATVSLPRLIAGAERAPLLRRLLEKVFKLRVEGLFVEKTPPEWARHFCAVLDAAGFPGERAPDSDEFQTLVKWHEALSELARLELVCRSLAPAECFAVLRRLCADTPFQPESPAAPVQVLGILESAGLRFDCLWVSGLTDEAWPLPARANPFIPLALQKKAGIPEASAEGSAALDRRLTDEWKRAAHEVVFSAYAKDQDRDLAVSSLIEDLPLSAIALPPYARYRDLLLAARKLEAFEDPKGPAFPGSEVRGGTRVLADQAACPFRAFARWRLAAEALEEPVDGPDARTRGSLLHAFMKFLWQELKGSEALSKNVEPALVQAADAAVKELELEGRFADLERQRLARLGREWLEVERTRAPFSVAAIEEKRKVEVKGLEFAARIDRMDALREGGHALIDYKTGQVSRQAWLGERPDEPQLPLYALNAPEEVTAVVYAQLKTGEMRFRGYSKEKGSLPKVDQADNWKGLVSVWKKETDALGAGFAAGEARVDPKHGAATCRICDLQTLCRVHEKPHLLRGEE